MGSLRQRILVAMRGECYNSDIDFIMKNRLFFFVCAVAFVVLPLSAFAGTFEANQNYQLNPGVSVNDNLYVAGSDMNVAGEVKGDFFGAGGTIIISGPIGGDLMSVGGTLSLAGTVSGDVRVAGGTVILSNTIGGELLAGGGTVNITSGSVVAGDTTIGGGVVNYDGTAEKNLTISGNKVHINGIVHGNVSVHAEEITLGPKTLIDGNFEYYAPKEMTPEKDAVIKGTVNFHKTEAPEKSDSVKLVFGFIGIAWLIKSLMILTAALIALYFFTSHTTSIIAESSSHFWKEAGRGFIVLIVVPVAIIISFVTIIGVPIGILALLFYVLLIIISSIIAPLLFARLLMNYVFKKENTELNWWIAILAVIVFGLVSFIPVVGWIICFFIFLASFGTVTEHIRKKLK